MTKATNNNDSTSDNVAPIPLPGVANRRIVPPQNLDLHADFLPGWVWLTGAGPGDPGLLTLHALNALRQADVVIYDALVQDCLL